MPGPAVSARRTAALTLFLRALLLATVPLSSLIPTRVSTVQAQTDPCPEPNNGYNNACFVGPGAPTVQGYLSQPGDVDAYRFQVAVPLAVVRLELAGLPADFDLDIWDGDAAFLQRSANSGTAAEIIELPLLEGVYYAFVNSTQGQASPGRPYTLTIDVTALSGPRPGLAGDPCPEPNDAPDTACPVDSGRLVAGNLASSADVDLYAFEVLEADSRLTIRLGQIPEDVVFSHLDSAGATVGESGPGFTLIGRVSAGRYFVRVSRSVDEQGPAPYELIVTVTPPSLVPVAASKDPCPEPNDENDSACELIPSSAAEGYISSPGDIDRYTFEVTDQRAWVHVELTDLPANYELEVQDAEGGIRGSFNSGTFPESIDLALDPGRYFVVVYSNLGQGSDDRPYHLLLSMRPLSDGKRPPSSVYFADNFHVVGANFPTSGRNPETYEVGYYDGEYVVTIRRQAADTVVEADEPGGTDAADFQLDVDVRMTRAAAERGGFNVNFRWSNSGNTYDLYVDTVNYSGAGAARLTRWQDGDPTHLSDWTVSPAIKQGSESNHITVRAVDDRLTVAINGQPVLGARDDAFKSGDVSLGAFTWDQPVEARFDNLLVTAIR